MGVQDCKSAVGESSDYHLNWLKYGNNHFYTFISIVRLKTMTPKIYKTRILPKVGNMTLLPNPGKPGFYGVGLPGRVISCQPCSSEPSLQACAIGTKISQTSWFHDKSNVNIKYNIWCRSDALQWKYFLVCTSVCSSEGPSANQ